MRDPGWVGTWRYALPAPRPLMRRFAWMQPPSRLHRMRGATIMAVGLAIAFSVGGAVLVLFHGRVTLGEPGSGLVVIFSLTGVVAVVSLRALHRTSVVGESTAERFEARCAVPQIAGLAVFVAGWVVGAFAGWWWPPLVGGVAWLIGAAIGAPTRSRVARAERAVQGTGESLLDELLVEHG